MEKELKIEYVDPKKDISIGILNRIYVDKKGLLDQFPNQPERSKREDSCEHSWFKTRTTPMQCMRCGALNTDESQ